MTENEMEVVMNVVNLQDVHVIEDCPDCDGVGRHEVEVDHQDTAVVYCERCFGTGEVYCECVECGAALMASDGRDVDVCRECRAMGGQT